MRLKIVLCGGFLFLLSCGIFLRGDGAQERGQSLAAADPVVADRVFAEPIEKRSNAFLTSSDGGTADADVRTASGFQMKEGASVRLNEKSGLRFRAVLDESFLSGRSEETVFGFVIAPKSYFKKVLELAQGEPDYVNGLQDLVTAYGATPALQTVCEPTVVGGETVIQASVTNILYANMNLSYSAAAYMQTTDGNGAVSYVYADYVNDPLTDSRSVAHVATSALQSGAVYSAQETEILNSFADMGAKRSLGLAEDEAKSIDDLNVGLSWVDETAELTVGTALDLNVAVRATVSYTTADGETMEGVAALPLVYSVSDPSVFVVADGKLNATMVGTSVVTVRYGTVSVAKEFTVKALAGYACSLTNASPFDLLDIRVDTARVQEGGEFQATLSVKDTAYGEIGFCIGKTYYTTEKGAYTFTATVTADTAFVITDEFTSWNYFSGSPIQVATGKTLPKKVVLPTVQKNGTAAITGIGSSMFKGQSTMESLVIPDCYTKIVSTNTFNGCGNLKEIYVYGDGLSNATGTNQNVWAGCTSLENIYVEEAYLERFRSSGFWSSKNGFWTNNDHLKVMPSATETASGEENVSCAFDWAPIGEDLKKKGI